MTFDKIKQEERGYEMLKLGEKQTLEIMKKVEFGVYLKNVEDTVGEERVLLPAKQVPEFLPPRRRKALKSKAKLQKSF